MPFVVASLASVQAFLRRWVMTMRKRILNREEAPRSPSSPPGLDVSALATVWITSEAKDFPIDNVFDGTKGSGATRWVAAEPGEQTLILEFDEPQDVKEIELEIEEREAHRIQELSLSASTDGGASYRELLRQEYHFSPSGATFEHEKWSVEAKGITHLRLRIAPDKDREKPRRAGMTSLVLR
jgi:hypothetical protein